MHNIVSKSWCISHAVRYFYGTEFEILAGIGSACSFSCLIFFFCSLHTKNSKKKCYKDSKIGQKHTFNCCLPTTWLCIVWCDASKRYISSVSFYCSLLVIGRLVKAKHQNFYTTSKTRMKGIIYFGAIAVIFGNYIPFLTFPADF